uniref:Keratin, type I cytoskeletal 20 n=1 Tax=Anolis carolinensis TaxID=28377 RepID=A0A803TA60_ANOCA
MSLHQSLENLLLWIPVPSTCCLAYLGSCSCSKEITVPSSSYHYCVGYQLGTSTNDLLLANDEKLTMQNLNDRLATYLEKVRSLEIKSSPVARQDYTNYLKTIEALQNKVRTCLTSKQFIILQIDNTKLAADDFRIKYETELNLRQNVENDTAGLMRLIDDLTLVKSDLEHQVEGLKEELAYLKKNHEEETERLRKQLGGTVSVEVDAAPGIDLGQMMDNMRQQYEVIAEKNRQEAKDWFDKQVDEWNVEVTTTTQQLETHKGEVTERRRTLQNLEIELQTQLNLKADRENELAGVEARYGALLAQIQATIANLEAQMMQLRNDMERQNQEYNSLLDIKVKLEAEIATYRRLLEGEDTRSLNHNYVVSLLISPACCSHPVKTMLLDFCAGYSCEKAYIFWYIHFLLWVIECFFLNAQISIF